MPVFIPEMQIMEKLSQVLPDLAFSENFHQNFDGFIHDEFSINQKMEGTRPLVRDWKWSRLRDRDSKISVASRRDAIVFLKKSRMRDRDRGATHFAIAQLRWPK